MRILFFLAVLAFSQISAHIYENKTHIEDFLKPIEGCSKESCGIDFVDKIYVINLDERKEKWNRMKSILDQYNLKAIRFSAINGWKLPKEVAYILAGNQKPRISPGNLGCILSHLSILKHAYESDYNAVWIMEDDIVIIEEPHQLSEMILKLYEIDLSWDILYTDIDSKDPRGDLVPSLGSDFRPNEEHLPLEYYHNRFLVDQDIMRIFQRFGNYSYIVSRYGMKKILDYFTHIDIWTNYDIDIHYIPSIREYSSTKEIVSVHFDNGISDTVFEMK
jgi:GR25 family glycosyltransferase involved in LPS biosynthesis